MCSTFLPNIPFCVTHMMHDASMYASAGGQPIHEQPGAAANAYASLGGCLRLGSAQILYSSYKLGWLCSSGAGGQKELGSPKTRVMIIDKRAPPILLRERSVGVPSVQPVVWTIAARAQFLN
ncbi:hypothetical protein TWF751_006683 [Orbilia oligospora]|nr:hypothetical protein TWF751_006683 [Orbilia oligospora]